MSEGLTPEEQRFNESTALADQIRNEINQPVKTGVDFALQADLTEVLKSVNEAIANIPHDYFRAVFAESIRRIGATMKRSFEDQLMNSVKPPLNLKQRNALIDGINKYAKRFDIKMTERSNEDPLP